MSASSGLCTTPLYTFNTSDFLLQASMAKKIMLGLALVLYLLLTSQQRMVMGKKRCEFSTLGCYGDFDCKTRFCAPRGYPVGICLFEGPKPRRCICRIKGSNC
ncbi:hypothetical protein OROMI_022832 [Orobanche minor]